MVGAMLAAFLLGTFANLPAQGLVADQFCNEGDQSCEVSAHANLSGMGLVQRISTVNRVTAELDEDRLCPEKNTICASNMFLCLAGAAVNGCFKTSSSPACTRFATVTCGSSAGGSSAGGSFAGGSSAGGSSGRPNRRPASEFAPLPACGLPTAADVCDVPAGQCATLVGQKVCEQVSVKGTLRIQSGSTMRTRLLRVFGEGTLQVGSPETPAVDVEIDLQNDGQLLSDGQVYIHGARKTSWTLLAETCDYCDTISVRECDGWTVGDNIVLVGQGDGNNGQVQANNAYRTDERKIRSISGCRITLDRSAGQKLRSELYKGYVPIKTEVLNMDRSVRIFGTSGIRTRQQHGGVMQIHYARVSNCGLSPLGDYCMHFHHVGVCPQCSFIGNAVGWPSINKGITVHSTSEALVEGNVIYDHRGAFLYVEDGDEIGNTIRNNALICPRKAPHCSFPNGIPEQRESDKNEQAGLYCVSAANNFIGNHIAGMENAFFQDFQGGRKIWGDTKSKMKTCPQASPFRQVSDNYFHNNNGFGLYTPHSSYPVRVKTNREGYVTDWNSCLGFDPATGEDNSAQNLVTNHVELFHGFGAGGYDGGETAFENAVFAFGLSGNYYKTFRRGVRTGPFCDGCKYVDDLTPNFGGGSCMWEFKNTVFDGIMHGLNINHHCGNDGEWTGGLCASHFWMTGSTEYRGSFKLNNDGFGKAKGYTDSIVYYQGKTFFFSAGAHPAFRTSGCESGQAGGQWTACRTGSIRIVRIYTSDRGSISIVNNNEGGHTTRVPYSPWRKTSSWGRPNAYDKGSRYQNGGMGYTFLVKAGQSYTIKVDRSGSLPDFFTLEYSDIQMPADSITLTVQGGGIVAGGPCTIKSTHRRDWITPYGPYVPESGAWWQCRKWAVDYTLDQHRQSQQRYLQNRGIQTGSSTPQTPQTGGGSQSCAPFSQWPSVKGGVTCDSCTALVATAPSGGRCDEYCRSFGHICVRAAEEQNDDCQTKYSSSCTEAVTGTSDMLCTCAKYAPQPGSTTQKPPSSNCRDDNQQCPSWAGLGECTGNPAYMSQNCKKSCRICQSTSGTTLPSTSSSQPASTTQKLPPASCGDSNQQCVSWARIGECAKNPAYMSDNCQKSCNLCQLTPSTTQPSGTATACAPFSQWPSVMKGLTCGSCTALVQTASNGGRCDTYCQSFGHTCVNAAEEQNDNCAVKYSSLCSQAITGTSDMLCTCASSSQQPAPTQQPVTAPQTPQSGTSQTNGASLVCASFSEWPNKKGGVTCSGCTALVLTAPTGGRCDAYCESFGHTCLRAAEERTDDCQTKYSSSCNQAITGTSDMLCTCTRSSQQSGSTPQTPQSANCNDGNQQCTGWAARGECTQNPPYMLANCKKSCGQC